MGVGVGADIYSLHTHRLSFLHYSLCILSATWEPEGWAHIIPPPHSQTTPSPPLFLYTFPNWSLADRAPARPGQERAPGLARGRVPVASLTGHLCTPAAALGAPGCPRPPGYRVRPARARGRRLARRSANWRE